ncbi:hypothetical protein FLG15_10440 [Xanthomonas phaseoli pv. dieffenbachiae]|uniref:hypothetical protein n=1 Tax=Xanthomonas phaseoli TaxID=1985254 RepID=UPI001237A61C
MPNGTRIGAGGIDAPSAVGTPTTTRTCMTTSALSREEFDALAVVAKARRNLLFQTFNGTRLSFGKRGYASGNAFGTGVAIYEFQQMIKDKVTEAAIPKITAAAEKFVADAADVEGFHEIVAALGSEAAGELCKEILPIIGIFYSAKKWAEISAQVIGDTHMRYKMVAGDYRSGFRSGTPQAAVDSVQHIIETQLLIGGIDWANQSVGLATKFAGLSLDMGVASTMGPGIAGFIADFVLKLTVIGMDIKEMRAGNRWLQTPSSLSIEVFRDCPILGCYLLISADTSSVANLFVADIGLPGWMRQLETMQESKIAPTVRHARKLVERSNLQLEGLTAAAQPAKTHVKKDFFVTSKSKVARMMTEVRGHFGQGNAA